MKNILKFLIVTFSTIQAMEQNIAPLAVKTYKRPRKFSASSVSLTSRAIFEVETLDPKNASTTTPSPSPNRSNISASRDKRPFSLGEKASLLLFQATNMDLEKVAKNPGAQQAIFHALCGAIKCPEAQALGCKHISRALTHLCTHLALSIDLKIALCNELKEQFGSKNRAAWCLSYWNSFSRSVFNTDSYN